jgi:hypothetical protein
MVRMPYRPIALRVMAEWGVEDPVWDSDREHYGPVALVDLDVSEGLIAQLREWNQRFNALHQNDYRWPDTEQERAWQADGLDLAYRLQNEMSDIEISYVEDGDQRPLRQRRGP